MVFVVLVVVVVLHSFYLATTNQSVIGLYKLFPNYYLKRFLSRFQYGDLHFAQAIGQNPECSIFAGAFEI
jgi:hypothetical protein